MKTLKPSGYTSHIQSTEPGYLARRMEVYKAKVQAEARAKKRRVHGTQVYHRREGRELLRIA
jgi:hypothetical protein